MMNKEISDLIIKYGKKYSIDPAIVYGICETESDFNQYAERYEPDYRWIEDIPSNKPKNCSNQTERMFQKTSIGIMQVMGGVFRQYGYVGWRGEILSNLNVQFDYGCRHLKSKIKLYGKDGGIIAYNSGSPHMKNGKYINQSYLDKVLKCAKEYPKKFCQVFKT